MAMINGVFVNLGCCGYSESAEGIGDTSLSGYRNFGKHLWPQMDIGSIKFHNPRTCVNEVESNRRLTRNQAIWLTNKITAYIDTLDIPWEEDFDHTESGHLRKNNIPEEDIPETLSQYLIRSATLLDKEGKAGWASAMREAANVIGIVRSLEASLTEAVRDNPSWAQACDHQALAKARNLLKSE